MEKYDVIPCPECNRALVLRTPGVEEPFYHCVPCDHYWLLTLGAGVKACLIQYDPDSDLWGQKAFPLGAVPEKTTYGVKLIDWQHAKVERPELREEIRRLVTEGNLVLVLDEGRPRFQVVVDAGEVTLARLGEERDSEG
ncbi:MAG: hypothetical protein K8R59_11110 [Thermoanaerobaculales bacterium]|nr:hypothetical protein [Thermoanaerobaculales bacterium]